LIKKKFIVCAFGTVGLGNLNQLLMIPGIRTIDIFVYTENKENNKNLIDYLKRSNINHSFKLINDCFEDVLKMEPQFIISMFYRRIIDDKILKICDYKTLNVHQSLLPLYKGRFIAFWTIFNNDKYAGITYHKMIKEVDSGEILLTKKIKLEENETAYSLHHKLEFLAINNFQVAFKRLNKNYSIKKKFTNLTNSKESSFFGNKLPFNGVLDAKKTSFDKAICFLKAMYFPPLPGAKFIINKNIIEIRSLEQLQKYKKYFKLGKNYFG
jgi:methionyl-tRNA formyltransferase